jgi:membrane protease YdiL (CAAX protease family)
VTVSHPSSVRSELDAFPHTEPQPYHLMLRTRSYAWWRPVTGMLVAALWFVIGTTLVYFAVAAVFALFQPGSWVKDFTRGADLRGNIGPERLLELNLGMAAMILGTWFIYRFVHHLRPRWLTSVVPRMRWRFFGVCLCLALLALVAQIVVGAFLPGQDGGGPQTTPNHLTATALVSGLVVLLTTPLQAAGEEYLFRGYLLTAFGALFRNRWVAIGLTAVIFAAAHGVQNAPLFIDRLTFGLIAGWLVTRTGGLEAGIALHVLNNFFALGLSLAYGDINSTLHVSDVSWWYILITLTQSVVYTVLVVVAAHKMGLQTRTRPPGEEPQPVLGPAAATA